MFGLIFVWAREARRRASGDDDVSLFSLIVGHATHYVSSQRPAPPPPPGQGLNWMRRMDIRATPDGKLNRGREWARFSTPTSPYGVWGALGGQVEIL
jgi:hypothetical protein